MTAPLQPAPQYLLGLFWILVAGIAQGIFPLSMKFMRRWKWEHLWLAYSCIALFLLPAAAAWATVPNLFQVLREAPSRTLWLTALFGFGWGAGSVTFGLGVDALGMALGFSMITGMYMALGALIPFLVLTPDLIWTTAGLCLISGNAIAIAGVILCAIAGQWKEAAAAPGAAPPTLGPKISFGAGLAICVASGALSGMLNFAYAFGKPIAEAAQRQGASSGNSANAVWLIAVPAGGILNAGYSLYLMWKRKSWARMCTSVSPGDVLHASVMSVLFTGSVVVYGWGADDLGRLGPSLGWSLWNAILIVATFVCGLAAKEWAGATAGRAFRTLLAGIALLVVATVLLGLGGAGG